MKGQEYIPMTHFIVNPQSRSGKGVLVWAEVEKQLKLKQNPYELHMTTCQGDAVKLARQLSNAANETGETVNIVGLGGDGTLCEVLNGLIISDKVNLGYLPTGSGNDFGRSMHYPSNILTMVERITDEPETMPIDFGTVKLGTKPFDENRFAVSCGIGYDAAVCDALLTSRVKKFFNSIHLGKLAYLVVGLMELFKMKLSNGYMVVDGKRIELSKVSFISCHIQPFEGGGFRFAPNAYAQDGLLEVCVMSGGNKFTTEFVGPLLKQTKLHCRITVHARIRRNTRKIVLHKRFNNRLTEFITHISTVMFDPKPAGKFLSRLRSTLTCITGNEGKTFNTISLREQHMAYGSAVYTTTHSHQYTLFCRHMLLYYILDYTITFFCLFLQTTKVDYIDTKIYFFCYIKQPLRFL